MRSCDRTYQCFARHVFRNIPVLHHRVRSPRAQGCAISSTSLKSIGNEPQYHSIRFFNDKPMQSSGDDDNKSRRGTTKKYDPTAKRPNRLCDPYGQSGQPMSYEAATKLRTKLHVDWIFDMPPSFVPTAITENSHSNSTTESSTIIHPSDTAHLDNISATNLTSIRPNTGNRKPYHNTTSTNQYALPLPMLTATEEVQRTFASLSPTTTAKTHPNNNNDDDDNNGNHSNSSNTMTTSTTTTTTTTHHQPSTDAHHDIPSPLALIRTFQHPDFMSGSRFLQSIAAVGQMTSHYPALSLERKIINRHWYIITTVRCHTVVLGGLSTFDFHLATMIDIEVERPEVRQNILQEIQVSLSKVWNQI